MTAGFTSSLGGSGRVRNKGLPPLLESPRDDVVMARSMEFLASASRHNPDLAAGASRYASAMGQPRPSMGVLSSTYAHPAMTSMMSRAYMHLPTHDPTAEPAFHAMRNETNRQFDFLTGSRNRGGLGVSVDVAKEDPYAVSKTEADPQAIQRMMSDLEQRHMTVLSSASTGGHPLFTDEENERFRAVHDAFGHAATGRGFDPHGEEAAYLSHASMYSPLARRALATETRGQNSALIRTGGFQPQKVALLPSRFSAPSALAPIGQRSTGAGAAAMLQARQFHKQAFGTDLPVAMP